MTTTTRTEQQRQPSGVPVGGQFTTPTRIEPDIELGRLDPSATSRADTAIVELTESQMLAAARASVRTHAWAKGVRFVGEDDMVQDTLEAVLKYKANNASIVITRPYVNTVGAGIVAQAARGRLRAEDRKAIGIFNRTVSEREAELGRQLTSKERDKVAAGIRADWPDTRHRPSADFVRFSQMRVLSLDATFRSGAGDDRTLGDTISDSTAFSTGLGADDQSVDPNTEAGRVLSGERTDRGRNRNEAWNLLATLSDIPAAVPDCLNHRNATACRAGVSNGGGVRSAAQMWLRGETSDATHALFAPFGHVDEAARDDIAQGLLTHPDYAEELWASAVSTASRRR